MVNLLNLAFLNVQRHILDIIQASEKFSFTPRDLLLSIHIELGKCIGPVFETLPVPDHINYHPTSRKFKISSETLFIQFRNWGLGTDRQKVL